MRAQLTACMLVLIAGCSAPDTSARVDPVGPDRAQFKAVAPMLVRSCGSIDCHGSPYRNLRVFGYGGARLEPNARPDFPARVTDVESDATYDAVIGIEPELTREVVDARGAGADRLSLVRKARGTEEHKGGGRIVAGSDADRCLTTWLGSAVDVEACNRSGCVGDGGVIEACTP